MESSSSAPEYAPGLWKNDSLIRTVMRERVIGVSGIRALILQGIDPLSVYGLLEHSPRFSTDILGRLQHTEWAMNCIYFGDEDQAEKTLARVGKMHAKVVGTIGTEAPEWLQGRPYRALDPERLLWVIATTFDSARWWFHHAVRPLSAAENDQLWKDFTLLGEGFGIPTGYAPKGYNNLQEYLHHGYRDPAMCVLDQGKAMAGSFLAAMPFPLRQLHIETIFRDLTLASLPVPVRDKYDFPWPTPPAEVIRAEIKMLKRAWAKTPTSFRYYNPPAPYSPSAQSSESPPTWLKPSWWWWRADGALGQLPGGAERLLRLSHIPGNLRPFKERAVHAER